MKTVLMFLSLSLVSGSQNLYIQHTATRFTVESRWLISSHIDVTPYSKQIESISDHLHQLRRFTRHCSTQTTGPTQKDQQSTIEQSKLQMDFAKNKIENLKQKLDNLIEIINKSPAHRVKRSLLPFLGNILGSITGVATEKDLRKINNHLKHMETLDSDLTHIVQDSITVVNATKFKLRKVIGNVNSLDEALTLLHHLVLNSTSDTYHRLDDLKFSVYCYNQLHSVLTMLLHNVDTLQQEILEFEMMIGNIMNHEVTMHVISPTHLKDLLIGVAKSMSKDLTLPYDLENNLLSYYKSLSCELSHSDRGPMIILAVPLRSSHSRYDIHHVMSVPIPYRNASVLSYDVKHPFVALSYDKTKVVFMKEQEYLLCTKAENVICHLSSPIRFTSQVQDDCSVALLISGSLRQCPVRLSPPSLVLPQAQLLQNGFWIIISNTSQTFTVLCPTTVPTTVTVSPPLGNLSLPIGCKAQSQHITIPPTYVTSTFIKFLPVHEFINYNVTVYDKLVGEKVTNFSINFPDQLTSLIDQSVSVTELEQRIHSHLSRIVKPHHSHYGTYYYYIWTPMIAIMILIGIVLYLSKKLGLIGVGCSNCVSAQQSHESTSKQVEDPIEMLPQGPHPIFGVSE